MKKISNKIKIIILAVGFIIFAFGMYLFGYSIMANKNQAIADTIAKSNVDLEVLLREQKSFEQGKKDLANLAKSQYPPDELFSSDTKVVKEIQQLESTAQKYSLRLEIKVPGAIKDAKVAPGTSGQLIAVPYIMTLEGSFDNILMFTQALERMQFATHVTSIALKVREDNLTTATYSSEFYIKK
jgi:hypothetical protein